MSDIVPHSSEFLYRPKEAKKGIIIAAQGQDPQRRLQYETKDILEVAGFVPTSMGSQLSTFWVGGIVPSWVKALDAFAVVLVTGYQTNEATDPVKLLLTLNSTCDAEIVMFDLAHIAPALSWGVADFASDSIDDIAEHLHGV